MNQVPAYLQHRQRRDLADSAVGGISSGQGPHISIAGNRFTLVDAAGNQRQVPTLHLDVCIIDANPVVSKIFYDPSKRFDPSGGENAPPLCFSDNGQGASAQAQSPQNTSCQLCPWNAWGSSTSQMTGKQTKACNDAKKLAVVVPGMGAMPFLLRVPPASLKNLAQYTNTMKGHGVDLPDALTRLEFESQGILKFTPVGYVDEQTARDSEAIWEAKGTDMLLGKLDRPWGGQADTQKLEYAQRQAAPLSPPQQAPQAAPAPFMAPPPPQPFAAPQPFQAPPGVSPAFPGNPAPPAMHPPAPPAAQEPKPRKPRTPKAAQTVDANAAPPFVQPQTAAPFSATPAVPFPVSAAPAAGPSTSAPSDDGGIPQFLQRNPQPGPAPAAPPQQNFGMQPNPPAPDAGIAAALDEAFRLPT